MSRPALVWVFLGVGALASAGCSGDARTEAGPRGTVVVFAAASLTDAFSEVETQFEAAHPEIDVRLNYAGSSSLREQVLEGAPADVYASANPANMAMLVDEGAVGGEPMTFARNTMQIAVPAGNPGDVTGLHDFADPSLFVGLCAVGVPCGTLARAVLDNAGVEPAEDTNELDVRALLTKIGADELDAGIVYATDIVAAADLVEGIEIPAAQNVIASYPIVVLSDGPNPHAARAFVNFVLSVDGQAIMADHGFAGP